AHVIVAGTLTYETLINSFQDVQACFNIIIDALNSDATTGFKNYLPSIGTTFFETVITNVNTYINQIALGIKGLPFVVGPVTIFKTYETAIEYLPVTLENFLFFKQFSEVQLFFIHKTFTNAFVKFAS